MWPQRDVPNEILQFPLEMLKLAHGPGDLESMEKEICR